jgi:hypothetical protein
MTIYSSADEWQSVHDLPTGAILVDDEGHAYQVERPKDHHGVDRWPGETWISPASDEYAFIVRREADERHGPKVGSYEPDGNLTLVWKPSWITAREVRADAMRRLDEIGDGHGCEAASARSFEEGRLAVLDDLGFRDMKIDSEEVIHQEPEDPQTEDVPATDGESAGDED